MNISKKSAFLVAAFLILGWGLALSAEIPAAQENPPLRPAERWQYAETTIHLINGTTLRGFLLGLEEQALVISVSQGRKAIPLGEIERVVVRAGNKGDPSVAFGSILGLYAGSLFYVHESGQPLGYMGTITSPLGLVLCDMAVVAAGGFFFGLLDPWKGAYERTYNFSGNGPERLARWERLRLGLAGVEPRRSVHLTLQAGSILAGGAGRYKKALDAAGYVPGNDYSFIVAGYESDLYTNDVGSFNLIRKIQLTFDLKPSLEVGLAYYPLSEPVVMAGKDSDTFQGDLEYDRFGYVRQTFAATGVYAVAVYKPLTGRLPKTLSWGIGLGLGVARFNYRLKAYEREIVLHNDYWVYSQDSNDSFAYAKTVPSVVVSTQFDWFLGANASLGLTADYVTGPSVRVPAYPGMGLGGRSLGLGRAGVGIVLGTHF
jgi:hypothetical protein